MFENTLNYDIHTITYMQKRLFTPYFRVWKSVHSCLSNNTFTGMWETSEKLKLNCWIYLNKCKMDDARECATENSVSTIFSAVSHAVMTPVTCYGYCAKITRTTCRLSTFGAYCKRMYQNIKINSPVGGWRMYSMIYTTSPYAGRSVLLWWRNLQQREWPYIEESCQQQSWFSAKEAGCSRCDLFHS